MFLPSIPPSIYADADLYLIPALFDYLPSVVKNNLNPSPIFDLVLLSKSNFFGLNICLWGEHICDMQGSPAGSEGWGEHAGHSPRNCSCRAFLSRTSVLVLLGSQTEGRKEPFIQWDQWAQGKAENSMERVRLQFCSLPSFKMLVSLEP